MGTINSFQGKHRFLSNFWPVRIAYDGLTYPSVEHAYQAQKAVIPNDRIAFTSPLMKAGQAKRMGRTISCRSDWDSVKVDIMRQLVREKFSMNHLHLRAQLMDTHPAILIEGNTWGDTFWGECRGKGANVLGRILMDVRAEILREQP